MLNGSIDTNKLKTKAWDGNSTKEFIESQGFSYPQGILGPTYGWQFRYSGALFPSKEGGVDQLSSLIHTIQTDPHSRRLLINLWNPSDVPKMVLPPCGFCYQFYVNETGHLDCKLTQRSSDIVLAGGWNIASCALFVSLLSHTLGLSPGRIIWSVGDVHVYHNQIQAAQTQINRPPTALPSLEILRPRPKDGEDLVQYLTTFQYSDIVVHNYTPHPALRVPFSA